jgi:GT2 family glycosyltransferase
LISITPISIAVLITCFNRKEKTIHCLESLFNQNALDNDFNIEIFLVDDGSTDGTLEFIRDYFPNINFIQGTGNLYWNRGMHLAWENAAATKDFDYYMWLNDDTYLFKNALSNILFDSFSNSIICGTTKSSLSGEITYGGFSNNDKKFIVPNGNYQNAYYCNGNCVFVPRNVFRKLGNLDPIFHHALGDFDYGLRARKNGFDIKVAPDYIGFCENHESLPKWRSNSINLVNRIKYLYDPLSGCNPIQYFVYDNRHNGIFIACIHFISLHLRCIFPFLWL